MQTIEQLRQELRVKTNDELDVRLNMFGITGISTRVKAKCSQEDAIWGALLELQKFYRTSRVVACESNAKKSGRGNQKNYPSHFTNYTVGKSDKQNYNRGVLV